MNPSIIHLGVLLAFALLFFANAEDLGQQVCALKGEIVLTGPTQIFCMKDLNIADGTRLITQGHPLTITAVGSINYGEPPAKGQAPSRYQGMRIYSFKPPLPQSQAAGLIYIYAHTSFGSLEIRNRGATDKDLSGEVVIEYVTRGKSYSQSVDVAPGTKVELIVNGYPLAPKAPETPEATPAQENPKSAATQAHATENPPAQKEHPSRPKPHRRQIATRPAAPPQQQRRYQPRFDFGGPPPGWNWSW